MYHTHRHLTIFADPAKPPPPALTPDEMSQRWPTTLPEHLAQPVGQWLYREQAAKMLMAANGTTEEVTARAWLVTMVRAGLVDLRDGDGCVCLLPEHQRPGNAEAEQRRLRLEERRRELEELGVQFDTTEVGAHG